MDEPMSAEERERLWDEVLFGEADPIQKAAFALRAEMQRMDEENDRLNRMQTAFLGKERDEIRDELFTRAEAAEQRVKELEKELLDFTELLAGKIAVGYDSERDYQKDRADKLELDNETLLSLVRNLVDEGECQLDHHGYCQTHGWMATEPPCPHARAKELLDGRPGE